MWQALMSCVTWSSMASMPQSMLVLVDGMVRCRCAMHLGHERERRAASRSGWQEEVVAQMGKHQ